MGAELQRWAEPVWGMVFIFHLEGFFSVFYPMIKSTATCTSGLQGQMQNHQNITGKTIARFKFSPAKADIGRNPLRKPTPVTFLARIRDQRPIPFSDSGLALKS